MHTPDTPPHPAPRLSVIVITKNEAERLGACLASLAFADETIVVDSGSQDGTVALAQAHGARVIATTDWPGFGRQKQRALDAARGTWVFSIDADEWVDARLAAAIRQITEAPGNGADEDSSGPGSAAGAGGASIAGGATRNATPIGYTVDRLSALAGQWMHHGSWQPDPCVRLFRRGQARFSEDLVHERLLIDGPLGRLPGRLLHNSMPRLYGALDKMNQYSSGRARDQAARGRHGGLGAAIGHGLWAFVRGYVFKRGFLDGRLGFVLAVLDAEASYYRHLKIWLDAQPVPHPLPPPKGR